MTFHLADCIAALPPETLDEARENALEAKEQNILRRDWDRRMGEPSFYVATLGGEEPVYTLADVERHRRSMRSGRPETEGAE